MCARVAVADAAVALCCEALAQVYCPNHVCVGVGVLTHSASARSRCRPRRRVKADRARCGSACRSATLGRVLTDRTLGACRQWIGVQVGSAGHTIITRTPVHTIPFSPGSAAIRRCSQDCRGARIWSLGAVRAVCVASLTVLQCPCAGADCAAIRWCDAGARRNVADGTGPWA